MVINSGGEGYELQIHINNYAMILSGIVYVIWLLALLREHKKNIADHFSNDEKIKLNWLRYLIYGLGVIWMLVIAQNVQGVSYDNFIFGSGVALVLIIGYFGIRQGRIFNPAISQPSSYPPGNRLEDEFKSKPGDTENDITKSEETPIDGSANEATIAIKKKYANSGLTDIASQNLYQELKKLMEQEKVYTEPELTLAALAEKLNIYPNYLSQVINEKEGKSFYDYINTLRVEEFIRQVLLPENGKFTMMSLAADCGFNSKSSFNKNFKKVTGQSPSAYLSKRRQDPGS
ncbi:MAG: helix-turn-helix domain-containing protein [Chitinophagaceae bacterium]|nr:helix-turn-helix domain-containing protein [Chitinophagaceae bacterium]